MSKQIDIEAV